ncbi:hypothetical protein DFQ28_000782 [Apophysomyces sp. BC1034]|nr:hypothetical protein DFQ30_000156 [Apophysomyces sp. BC1015]KAG0181370.1 hypothetical protein DFQ29_008508 [Apophysomyces sp. BC1021]KAG0191179.1 hypothetical protein DFQ28_000782 [Apophysomyces sp. BC1034]
MATPTSEEVLFVVMIVIIFFIVLLAVVYIFHKATSPTKREMQQAMQQQQQQQPQVQYITASQLEAMKPSLLKQLYGQENNKRQSLLQKFFKKENEVAGNDSSRPFSGQSPITLPSSIRSPSFKPMRHQSPAPTIVVVDDAQNGIMRHPAPPAYGDHRTSTLLRCDDTPMAYTGEKNHQY